LHWVAAASIGLLVGLSQFPLAAPAQGKADEKARPPVVDARADKLLKQMGSYLAAAKQFSFRAEIDFDEMLPSGQMIQLAALEDVAVRRPDRAYVEYLGDLGAKKFWYDGKRVTVFDGAENVYASAAAPGKLDAMTDQLLEKQGFQPPLADFLRGNPYTVLKQHALLGAYLGLHDAGGVRCHHLAFVDKSFDWQIWIEDGTQTVPRKMVITYKQLPGSPRFEALFSDWNLDEHFGDALFTPVIPDGAVQIDFATVKREAGER
jgi:hypothetical protein